MSYYPANLQYVLSMANENNKIYKHADKDGNFRRKDSVFRSFVSRDPSSQFPAESGRYALIANLGCPWAGRALLVRRLKGLDSVIQLILTDPELVTAR